MRGLRRHTLAFALAWLATVCIASAHADPAPAPTNRGFPQIAILCYHDISPDTTAPLQTVSPEFLREQIRACRAEGWTVLSLAQLLAEREHPERLPHRVMVLTFDDGYRSFAERALPILRAEGIRPTLAVITSFVEQPHLDPALPPLLTWAELRALDAAGDVELASHSHALHRYETSNPFGDTAPSVATRRWLPAGKRYEDREEYRSRVGSDLTESQHVLVEKLGHAATTLVWPYGMHDAMARGLAARAGFSATLALGARAVTAADLRSGCLPRIMVTRRFDFRAGAAAWFNPPPAPLRAAQVDLDAIWDPDETVFRARIDQVVTRVKALGVNTVILPVCPGPNGEGRILRAYAMNHQLPVLADVWSMVAAKFAVTRLRVWVRAPALNLSWAWAQHPEWRLRGDAHGRATRWGTRLSPDLPGVRTAASDYLTDLAVYLPIDGVLFDDDAFVLPGEHLALERTAGAAVKSQAVRGLLDACRDAVTQWRPDCRFARCVNAADARPDDGESAPYLQVVEVGNEPGATGHVSAAAVGKLARRVASRWKGKDVAAPGVMLLLPAYDRSAHEWFDARTQQECAAAALAAGIVHLGTSPVAAEGPTPVGLLDTGPARAEPPRAAHRN